MAYSGFIKLLTAADGVRWIYQLRREMVEADERGASREETRGGRLVLIKRRK